MADPDISDDEFDTDAYLGDNCIVFENFTTSIGGLMVANRVYYQFLCNFQYSMFFVDLFFFLGVGVIRLFCLVLFVSCLFFCTWMLYSIGSLYNPIKN
jgi:hypothetical protein